MPWGAQWWTRALEPQCPGHAWWHSQTPLLPVADPARHHPATLSETSRPSGQQGLRRLRTARPAPMRSAGPVCWALPLPGPVLLGHMSGWPLLALQQHPALMPTATSSSGVRQEWAVEAVPRHVSLRVEPWNLGSCAQVEGVRPGLHEVTERLPDRIHRLAPGPPSGPVGSRRASDPTVQEHQRSAFLHQLLNPNSCIPRRGPSGLPVCPDEGLPAGPPQPVPGPGGEAPGLAWPLWVLSRP